MFLAIDVGNTHTVLGVYDGTALQRHWRLQTDPGRTMEAMVRAGTESVYHAGDTALFGDMAHLGRGGLDLAVELLQRR